MQRYTLTKSSDNKMSESIVLMIIAAIIVIFIIYALFFSKKGGDKKEGFYAFPYAMYKNKDEYYPPNTDLLFAGNKCCKSCCKNLWPVPFDVDDCKTTKDGKPLYVSSVYTCNGEKGSGCVCVKPEQADFLDRRGNNKRSGERVMFEDDMMNYSKCKSPMREPTKGSGEPEEIAGTQEASSEDYYGLWV